MILRHLTTVVVYEIKVQLCDSSAIDCRIVYKFSIALKKQKRFLLIQYGSKNDWESCEEGWQSTEKHLEGRQEEEEEEEGILWNLYLQSPQTSSPGHWDQWKSYVYHE